MLNHQCGFVGSWRRRYRVVPSAMGADTPTITLSRTSATYVENDIGFYVDAGIQIAFPSTINGAKVSIGNDFIPSQDQLLYSTTAGISGSYSAATGVLTLIGEASAGSYQAALRAVRYFNSSDVITHMSQSWRAGGQSGKSVSGGSTLAFTYQWIQADDASGTNAVNTASATSSTYVLTNADAHNYLGVLVTCTDNGVYHCDLSLSKGDNSVIIVAVDNVGNQ